MTSYFEWDEKKNAENKLKHGVSFFQAQQAFQDPNRRIAEDLDHSVDELRYYCSVYLSRSKNSYHWCRLLAKGEKNL